MEMSPIVSEGLQNLGPCSALRAFEKGDLCRATPVATWGLNLPDLIRKTTPFNCLLRHTMWSGPILTLILKT